MNVLNRAILIALVLIPGSVLCAECPDSNACTSQPACVATSQTHEQTVDSVLQFLSDKAAEFKSYEGLLEYKFTQPLLESTAVRKGVLWYARFDKRSKLRINFETLKQDEEKEQKYVEHYIFDGLWLTQLNYQIKSARRYQLAEPNDPADAFDVASRNIPLLGFTKPQELKKQFEIELVRQQDANAADLIQLHLKVKPDSIYKDDYVTLDFWMDGKSALPTKVVALSTEEDIYELKFLKPKVNKGVAEKVFEFVIPRDFGEPEIVPLKKQTKDN